MVADVSEAKIMIIILKFISGTQRLEAFTILPTLRSHKEIDEIISSYKGLARTGASDMYDGQP
jgi:hypothetical protein